MINSLAIRRARPDEAGRLTQIAFAAKRHWGYPAPWVEAWRADLTITPGFVSSNPVYAAVGCNDVAVACYALIVYGAEVELAHLWVDPAVIGRGLGRALFNHAAATARARGGIALCIDSDPNAEPFYERMGALRCGVLRADVCGNRRELPGLRFDLIA